MRRTSIEWTDFTVNFWVGCSLVSAGCVNCYAQSAAWRLQQFGVPAYQGVSTMANGHPVWTGEVRRGSAATWRKPFLIREPARIFCNSMADFWHGAAPDAWRLEALGIMRELPRHQFQLLTKRAEEIQPFLERTGASLPGNAWVGVTVERADVTHRIELLRAVPAAIRFLSIEPLIGPVGALDLRGIGWVIIGGESGPGARLMHESWLRDVIGQCREQNVPTYFKQWGRPENNPLWHAAPAGVTPRAWVAQQDPIGKGGSRLDGRRYTEYPSAQG